MLAVLSKAFLLGGMLSLFIGPVFFMLIQASVKDGFKGGLKILYGLYLSDIIYVILTYYFFEFLKSLEIPESSIKVVGGLFFILIGVFYFIKKAPEVKEIKIKKDNYALKSFTINSLNPSVFFFWFAVLSWGNEQFDTKNLIIYLAAGLCFAFLFDCLKILFSIRLTKLVNSSGTFGFNKVIGTAIILIGASLVYSNL